LPPIRVLIVDDQHLFAESLKFVLQGESHGRIEVVATAANGQEAVDLVRARAPDVILMDIRMPVMDGVDATAAIHGSYPNIKILILTTFDDDELAAGALSRGATGYVLKDVDPPDLILSIEAVHRGAFFISPSVGLKLVDIMKPEGGGAAREKEDLILRLMQDTPSLTRREAEILYLAAKARANKSIGDELFISEKTVKNHLSSIYQKLSIHNRLQLIHYVASARTRGLR
jgi:two-component system response regulator DegU